MSKLWCIALAFGDPREGLVVVSMQAGGLQEMAVAQAVSDVYRQTGTKLPLMGVNCRELTRDYLEAALKAMDEDEPQTAPVVKLWTTNWTDEQLANHFGQTKTKAEIEQLVGRPIDPIAWDKAVLQKTVPGAYPCNHDWALDPIDPLRQARRCRWCGTPEPDPRAQYSIPEA